MQNGHKALIVWSRGGRQLAWWKEQPKWRPVSSSRLCHRATLSACLGTSGRGQVRRGFMANPHCAALPDLRS